MSKLEEIIHPRRWKEIYHYGWLWRKTFHLWRDTARKRVWITRGYQPLFMLPKWLVRY